MSHEGVELYAPSTRIYAKVALWFNRGSLISSGNWSLMCSTGWTICRGCYGLRQKWSGGWGKRSTTQIQCAIGHTRTVRLPRWVLTSFLFRGPTDVRAGMLAFSVFAITQPWIGRMIWACIRDHEDSSTRNYSTRWIAVQTTGIVFAYARKGVMCGITAAHLNQSSGAFIERS